MHGSWFIQLHTLQAGGRVTGSNTLVITQRISREEFCISSETINITAVRVGKLLQNADSAVESLWTMVLPCLALS
jgi:hypothetical protein